MSTAILAIRKRSTGPHPHINQIVLDATLMIMNPMKTTITELIRIGIVRVVDVMTSATVNGDQSNEDEDSHLVGSFSLYLLVTIGARG